MKTFYVLVLALTIVSGCECQKCKAGGQELGELRQAAVKKWYRQKGTPSVALLYVGEAFLGKWDHVKREYRPWEAGRFGNVCDAPIPPPAPPLELVREGVNYGVDLDKLGGPEYVVDGYPASREEVFQALEEEIPNDATKARVTVMGPKDKTEPAMRNLREWIDRKKLADKVILWAGSEDDAILKRRGFEVLKPDTCTVFVQDPTGKLLSKFSSEPLTNADLAEYALSKWDPKTFPPPATPFPWPTDQKLLTFGALAAVGAYIISCFRKPKLA